VIEVPGSGFKAADDDHLQFSLTVVILLYTAFGGVMHVSEYIDCQYINFAVLMPVLFCSLNSSHCVYLVGVASVYQSCVLKQVYIVRRTVCHSESEILRCIVVDHGLFMSAISNSSVYESAEQQLCVRVPDHMGSCKGSSSVLLQSRVQTTDSNIRQVIIVCVLVGCHV